MPVMGVTVPWCSILLIVINRQRMAACEIRQPSQRYLPKPGNGKPTRYSRKPGRGISDSRGAIHDERQF